jgi:hypothetical protein
MITNKCFLYIDGYPRNARDVPFDMAIDWGDGSDIEEYFRLHVEKIPPLTHVYHDTQPREISVTLLKHSCEAENNRLTKWITYTPFDPARFERKCENSVSSLPGVQVVSYFANIVRHVDGSVTATLVTDVSTSPDVPLVKFLKKVEKLPEGVFGLVPPEITRESVVTSLETHTGNNWIPGSDPFIPPMTSNTAPAPFSVSASTTTYGSVWNAFDRSGKTGQDFSPGNYGFWGAYYGYYDTVWLKVDLGEAIRIIEYSLECADLSGISVYPSFTPPRYWRLMGSNDNSQWEVMDERSNISWNISPSKNETKKFSISGTKTFRWCRLEIQDGYYMYYEGHVGIKGFQIYAPSGETTIKGADVDFLYLFNPNYIDHIVLKGDEKFAQRIGTMMLPEDTLDPPAQHEWVKAEMKGTVQLWEVTVPVKRQTDSIRLGIHRAATLTETAVYYALRIVLDPNGTLIQTQQDIHVGVNVFYGTDGQGMKLGAGMAGSLVYKSEQHQKLSRIEIIGNANAYARLIDEAFLPSEEDAGDVTYCRGIKIFDPPEMMEECVFAFDTGVATLGHLIGEGLIKSIHFYREAIESEHDSPIFVSLELISAQNIQESVCFYIDEDGRHHCVAVNHLQLTQTDFSNLQHANRMSLTINLDTDDQNISGICSGTINYNCLLNAIQP